MCAWKCDRNYEGAGTSLREYFDEICYVKTKPIQVSWPVGKSLDALASCKPKAICVYSDGSTHEKMVEWDEEALCRVDVE